VAVIVALWLLPMVVVVALNVAEVVPADTVTDAGTVRAAFVLVSATLAPPVGAAWVRVTVQVLDELGPTLLGLQTTPDTSTADNRLIAAVCELLPRVAVTLAL
jgi:hypothetical protein